MAAGDVAGVTLLLDDLAAVAVADGDLVRAARLSGLRPASRRARAPASPASWRTRSSCDPSPEAAERHVPRGSAAAAPRARRCPSRRRSLRAGRDRVGGACSRRRSIRPSPDGAGVTGSLPAGVVTFLFTDIEGSTRLAADIGDTAYSERPRCRRPGSCSRPPRPGAACRSASEGDALFVAFADAAAPSAPPSPRSGRSPRTTGAATPIRVRMGLHTGEVGRRRRDYVGIEVHRAARVAAAGHGGQVLLSDATRGASRAISAPGSRCATSASTGSRTSPDPERIYQVVADGLETAFPAAPDARPHAQQPAAPADHVRRAGGADAAVGAAGPRPGC